ncbi:CYTH domain-containing protein [Bradyrhizobium sp. LHD-71]|uniref:CYTH domain-containing protein n=1 Tax=Bradyrhizobium sp. LHD-71 TaxID=3072141 RepID=UPI00280D7A09|nr:CYTH domain-containing protein [Bradyrhizobium sp. LHD-71]MDQ8727179.1 CYTH domain-containing protein [Bradyrhizobium sp. LHD-71]
MPKEIERKFLVAQNGWRKHADRGRLIRQAYLAVTDELVLRVRTIGAATAFLTIKTAGSSTTRSEFEYPIPPQHARSLMKLRTGRLIVKRRHLVKVGKTHFEIDVFARDHRGLVLAEVELPSRRAHFERPKWLGKEVTGKKRYYNEHLAGV